MFRIMAENVRTKQVMAFAGGKMWIITVKGGAGAVRIMAANNGTIRIMAAKGAPNVASKKNVINRFQLKKFRQNKKILSNKRDETRKIIR